MALDRGRLIANARGRLCAAADPVRAEKASAFFPSRPSVLGTPSGFSRQVGGELARQLKADGDLQDVIAVAEELFRSGIMEEGACANELVGRFWRRLGPAQWEIFDRWMACFTCWGTTDSFCIKVLSQLVVRDGPPMERLREWARFEGVWHRRAALACLVRAARKATYVEELYELADMLLPDPEDMVQKAIGWMLKELCRGDVEATVSYLSSRRHQMSPRTLRHAAERLTLGQRARAVTAVQTSVTRLDADG